METTTPLSVMQTNHPVELDKLRRIFDQSVGTLLIYFIAILLAVSFLFAFFTYLLEFPSQVNIVASLFIEYLIFFCGGDWPTSSQLHLVVLLANLTRLFMHVLLLGVLLSRFLVGPKKYFRYRKRLSIYNHNRKGSETFTNYTIYVRMYNATRSQLLNVIFQAYLRIPFFRRGTRLIRNKPLTIAKPQGAWPISLPKVPYTSALKLKKGDVLYDAMSGLPYLNAIQGSPLYPKGAEKFDDQGEAFLIIVVSGNVPSFGSTFSETHWYRLTGDDPDLDFHPFGDIQVLPSRTPEISGGSPSRWKGWQMFDAPSKTSHYVFGYGSLIDPDEMREYLPSGIEITTLCTLRGFRRSWNVAMDNTVDLPGYKYYVDQDGNRPDCRVTYLNISPENDVSVGGVLFPVTEKALMRLDRRERNYRRVDVTSFIDQPLRKLRVWTYVGSEEGIERFEEGRNQNKSVISRRYKYKVEEAFRKHEGNLYQQYCNDTEDPGIEIVKLELKKVDY